MKYNIYIITDLRTHSILDVTDAEIKKIIKAYHEKFESYFIRGKKIHTGNLIEMQIFTFEKSHFKTEEELFEYCRKNDELESGYFSSPHVPQKILKLVGKNVNEQFITDEQLETNENNINNNYVDLKRIKEFEKLNSNNFDFTRLIAVLKEINIAYKNQMKFAIPPLIRSVIDQVPPIFSKVNFGDVCGSYGSKSFKDSMNILDKSSRKIADAYLHTQIRQNEASLPTETQINFKNDLDVLLQEIIRKIKAE